MPGTGAVHVARFDTATILFTSLEFPWLYVVLAKEKRDFTYPEKSVLSKDDQ